MNIQREDINIHPLLQNKASVTALTTAQRVHVILYLANQAQ